MRVNPIAMNARSGLSQMARQRTFATIAPVSSTTRSHKIVVVGGGAAGTSISHQLLKAGGFKADDIALDDTRGDHLLVHAVARKSVAGNKALFGKRNVDIFKSRRH